jgi:hypothetical protein
MSSTTIQKIDHALALVGGLASLTASNPVAASIGSAIHAIVETHQLLKAYKAAPLVKSAITFGTAGLAYLAPITVTIGLVGISAFKYLKKTPAAQQLQIRSDEFMNVNRRIKDSPGTVTNPITINDESSNDYTPALVNQRVKVKKE